MVKLGTCDICSKDDVPKKKYPCSKTCSKAHFICKECYKKIYLDNCPYCKLNVYLPDPNIESYYKNLGMLHEFSFFKSEKTKKYEENCQAVQSALDFVYSTEKKTEIPTLNMSKNFTVESRIALLKNTSKTLNNYNKIVENCQYNKILYIEGRIQALEYLKLPGKCEHTSRTRR